MRRHKRALPKCGFDRFVRRSCGFRAESCLASSGATAMGVAGALFFALKPHIQTGGSELYNTNNRTTPEGLANLPHDYSGLPHTVPQLAPLPGDLGTDPQCRCAGPRHAQPGAGTPEHSALPRNKSGARKPTVCDNQSGTLCRTGSCDERVDK